VLLADPAPRVSVCAVNDAPSHQRSPDPVSAHLATVGGNIIENAGSPNALGYGVTCRRTGPNNPEG
jgi:hypothetical protein